MVASAPRLERELLERLETVERSGASVAEIRRCLVRHAFDIGAPPPSYEHVRRLVLALRRKRMDEGPGLGEIAVDVAFRARPVEALLDAMLER